MLSHLFLSESKNLVKNERNAKTFSAPTSSFPTSRQGRLWSCGLCSLWTRFGPAGSLPRTTGNFVEILGLLHSPVVALWVESPSSLRRDQDMRACQRNYPPWRLFPLTSFPLCSSPVYPLVPLHQRFPENPQAASAGMVIRWLRCREGQNTKPRVRAGNIPSR